MPSVKKKKKPDCLRTRFNTIISDPKSQNHTRNSINIYYTDGDLGDWKRSFTKERVDYRQFHDLYVTQ